MRNANEAAYQAGVEMAEYLNSQPKEAQNWSALTSNDDIPREDYVFLKNEFGDITPEMEREYKKGFNNTFGQ